MKNTTIATIAAGTAVIAITVACGTGSRNPTDGTVRDNTDTIQDTDTSNDNPIAELGDTITINGAEITLSDLTIGATAAHSQPDNGTYVTVHVAVKALDDNVMLTGGNFTLVADDGTAYTTTVAIGLDIKELDIVVDLNKGNKTDGYIVFDANPDLIASGATITYDDLVNGVLGTWKL